MRAKLLAIAVITAVVGLMAGSMCTAEAQQWVYMGNNTWVYVGAPIYQGGEPTISTFNPVTGAISYHADYGLMRSGLPPITFQNQTGGTTVLKQYRTK